MTESQSVGRHPHHLRAVLYMAEALYNLCEFEYSLMGYQRAARLAQDNETAQMGVVKCKKTITGNLQQDVFDMTGSRGEGLAEFITGEKIIGKKRMICIKII